MRTVTFAECFCAKHNIPPEKFTHAVFNRVLYRRTHLFRWLLPLIDSHYFAADFDLIYSVEQLSRMRDFVTEVERFNDHPANRGLLRRTFCLRVSTSRLKALIRKTLPEKARGANHAAEGLSTAPFEASVPAMLESPTCEGVKAGDGLRGGSSEQRRPETAVGLLRTSVAR